MKMNVRGGIYKGACWSTLNDRDSAIELQECKQGAINQLFVLKDGQIWSMVSPNPLDEELLYCVVHEHSDVLRTRRCYESSMGEVHTQSPQELTTPGPQNPQTTTTGMGRLDTRPFIRKNLPNHH